MKNILKNQEGSLLILAIIIISGLLIVGIEFAIFVINNIRQAKNIDNSQVAYYAAETGAENGLYQIRKRNVSPTDPLVSLKKNLPNQATFDTRFPRINDQSDSLEKNRLNANEFSQINLYKDNISDLVGVNSVKVTWVSEDCSGPISPAWLETSYIEWTPSSTINWNSNNVKKVLKPGPTVIVNFDPLKNYLIRLKPFYCDLKNVQAVFYDGPNGTGNIVKIPNQVTIRPLGEFKNATQSVKVSFPRYVPASGVYDYVLFSQETINK